MKGEIDLLYICCKSSYLNKHKYFSLLRGKSVSTEDLAQLHHNDSDTELGHWNRVSKLRRSLQYPSPSSLASKEFVRPPDFPKKSVDVNKIRLELESICGSRSQVKSPSSSNFVALDSILRGAEDKSK